MALILWWSGFSFYFFLDVLFFRNSEVRKFEARSSELETHNLYLGVRSGYDKVLYYLYYPTILVYPTILFYL